MPGKTNKKNKAKKNSNLRVVEQTTEVISTTGEAEESSVVKWVSEHIALVLNIISIIGIVIGVSVFLNKISIKLDNLNDDMQTIKTNVETMKVPVSTMWMERTGQSINYVASAEETDKLYVLDYKRGDFVASLVDVDTYGIRDVSNYSTSHSQVCAYGIDGTEYTLAELENNPILVPYTQDDKLVVFLGCFNEKGHWDNECAINVYDSTGLILSSVENYDDGVSRSKVVCFISQNHKECSYIQSCEDEEETFDCFRYSITSFKSDKPQISQLNEESLETPSDFLDRIKDKLIHHYHGKIENERYSDDTGNSYFIGFYDDGTVKTLYNGGFKNGEFHDETGRAWYITRDRDNNTFYMYYRGVFRNGNVSRSKDEQIDFENPVRRDTVWFLVNGRNYEDELLWDYDYIAK